MYELGPSGTTFDPPAVLNWRLPLVNDETVGIEVATWDATRGLSRLQRPLEPWVSVDMAADGSALTMFELSHFSLVFMLGSPYPFGVTRVAETYEVGTVFEAVGVASLPIAGIPFASPPELEAVAGGPVGIIRSEFLPASRGLYSARGTFICKAKGKGVYGFNLYIELSLDPDLPPTRPASDGSPSELVSAHDLWLWRRPKSPVANTTSTLLLRVECVGSGAPIVYGCCTSYGKCYDATEDTCFGRPMYEPCNEETCPNVRGRVDACCKPDGLCTHAPHERFGCSGTAYPNTTCEDLGPCPGSVIDGIPIPESAGLGTLLEWDIDDGRCTELSNKEDCQRPEPSQRIDAMLDPLLELSAEMAQALFEESFPCVNAPQGVTLCAPDATGAPGTYVFLIAQFGDEIPLDGDRILQYAFVFETDGDEATDFVPHPSFPGDFFAGTDRWYEALYDPNDGWRLLVREVSPALAEVPSGARIVILGRQMAIFIPEEEIDSTVARFRVTAFSHTGDYGLTGGPWSGDYYPPLEYPLLPIAQVTFGP